MSIAADSGRLPVCTVGGFLGAGKTTLVNHLLRSAGGRRLAVLVNDFGALNIDHALIETVEEDRIALTNGCVCCTIREGLVRTLADLARRATPVDLALVEVSGVADPVSLSYSLRTLEDAGLTRTDTLVYLVDAAGFPQLEFEDAERVLEHAGSSDVVVINKTDLVNRDSLDGLRSAIADVAPDVPVVGTVDAALSPELVFSQGASSRDARRHEHSEQPGGPDAVHGFASWCGETPSPIDRAEFDRFVRVLATVCWRAKGIVNFRGDPALAHEFHLVGSRATLEACTQSLAFAGRSSIVAIGRAPAFDSAVLDRAFERTFTDHE